MKILIGCDHGGYALKLKIKEHLLSKGIEVEDYGTDSEKPVDYPDFAEKVAKDVAAGKAPVGILICGTGIGMSIAANKVHGIRAALCDNCYSAQKAKEHNDANIICLGARVLGFGLAEQIVDTYLASSFLGTHHVQRIEKIMNLEK
jgi:ribose 5-phosphate isomerase B